MKLAKALALAAAVALPASVAMAYDNAPATPRANVLEVADKAGNFQTLLIAANNAGLISRFTSPLNRVTVLAPTDEAFAKLPKGTFEALMHPQNRDKLAELVNSHIVPGGVPSWQFKDQALELPTLAGNTVTLNGSTAGAAKIEHTDVIASNGIIHVIDQVLVPKS